MPYKSDAQRRLFHAKEAKGDTSSKVVAENDKASKGKKPPEKVKTVDDIKKIRKAKYGI